MFEDLMRICDGLTKIIWIKYNSNDEAFTIIVYDYFIKKLIKFPFNPPFVKEIEEILLLNNEKT